MKLNLISVFLLTTMLLALANAQLLPCSDADEEVARDNASGREFESCSKALLSPCQFTATYTDGSQETYNSPDGQHCVNAGGLAPTGTCKHGTCSRKHKR